MQSKLLPGKDDIPAELWDIFPPHGDYVKNIIKFSGYETRNSILKLRDRKELEKAFEFVKSICDIIPNKVEMFGIFNTNPQRVMLLPGLEVIKTQFSFSHI